MTTTLAHTLTQACNDKGWSVTRLAKESDVNRSFVSRVLNGETPPRTRNGRLTAEHDPRYRRLAEALDLEPDDVIVLAKQEQLGNDGNADTERASLTDGLKELVSAGWAKIEPNAPGKHLFEFLRFTKAVVRVIDTGQAELLRNRILALEPAVREEPLPKTQPSLSFSGPEIRVRETAKNLDNQRRAEKVMIDLGNFFVKHSETEIDFDTRADLAGFCFLMASRNSEEWPKAAKCAEELVEKEHPKG